MYESRTITARPKISAVLDLAQARGCWGRVGVHVRGTFELLTDEGLPKRAELCAFYRPRAAKAAAKAETKAETKRAAP